MADIASANIPVSFSGLDALKAQMNSLAGDLKSKLGGGLSSGLAMIGLAAGIGATVAMCIKKAMDAEKSMAEMKGLLKETGQEVDGNMQKFKGLATAISQTTTVSRGQVNELIKMALQHGATADSATHLSTTALGLSKRLGMDATTAMELLTRGDERSLKMLGKHSTEIAKATTLQGKLDAINRVAAEGMALQQDELNTTAGGFEHLLNQVSSLCKQFGDILLPVVNWVVKGVSVFFDWIGAVTDATRSYMSTNDSCWGGLSGWIETLSGIWDEYVSLVKTAYEAIIYGCLNWKLTLQIYIKQVILNWITFGERLAWVFENAVIYCQWAFSNFSDIIKTEWSFAVAAFSNGIENIKRLWDAFKSWISGGEWTMPEMKSLTEGAQNYIKEMPKFTEFAHSAIGQQIEDGLNKDKEEWLKGFGEFSANVTKAMPDKDKAKGIVDKSLGISSADITGNQAKESKGGGFSGMPDLWKKMQESIMKGQQEQTQKKIEKNTLRAAKAMEKLADKKQNNTAVAG